MAIQQYWRGEFAAATSNLDGIIQRKPHSPDAYVWLVRVYLSQNNVDLASESVAKGLSVANSPLMHVVAGEVYFRQGLFAQAENEWTEVIDNGNEIARAYFGLSRLRRASSLYAQAKALLERAHDLDPADPDIEKYWIDWQSKTEQIKFWEKYLASPTNDTANARTHYQQYLDYLKATEFDQGHPCELTSNVLSTNIPMIGLNKGTRNSWGYGLESAINGKKGDLMLDTGAYGIVLDEEYANEAGISRISKIEFRGIGDLNGSNGFIGIAKNISVGELKFHDCVVLVREKHLDAGTEGMVGANLFDHFLVDIDFPKQRLRLSPLPQRPSEGLASGKMSFNSLKASCESPRGQSTSPMDDEWASCQGEPPHDRFIAPEMKGYTQVYRLGHILLVPTRIEGVSESRFVIDSGGWPSLVSDRYALSIKKVQEAEDLVVNGPNGTVEKVYTSEVGLEFGKLHRKIGELNPYDLSPLSQSFGTEFSGILGINSLSELDIRIDYRDGLVDFRAAPNP